MTNLKEAIIDTKTKPNTAFKNELLEKLPQFFTATGEFDIEKFRDNLSQNNINEIKDGYTLNYVGKTYARLQTGQPTKTVIIPDQKHNKLSENKDSKNVFLTGDNLDVLKHLQKAYSNSIDFIYIDPPYNTGSDGFIYKDRFNLTDDQLRDTLNFTDDEINRLKMLNGRSSHSAWLTFMYPRLKIAQQLLKDTGVIFVSIDDNEQANLKLLMDDIFGEGNFVSDIVVNVAPNGRDYGHIAKQHEYILIYAKSLSLAETYPLPTKEKKFKYKDEISEFNIHPLYNSNEAFTPVNRPNLYYSFWLNPNSRDENGFYQISLSHSLDFSVEIYPPKSVKNQIQFVWRWGRPLALENLNIEIVGYSPSENEWRIVQKMRTDEKIVRSLFNDSKYSGRRGTSEVDDLFGGKVFSFPKPKELILQLLRVGTSGNKDAIVLDFFAGSATTADAVMQLNAEDGGNRQFILATLDEEADSDVARSAGFDTIDQISRERIRRAAQKIKNENPDTNIDLGFKHFLVKDVEANTIDKIVEFNPNVLFVDDMVAEFAKADLGATGADTILQTWLIGDGYKFDTEVTKIKFATNVGYQVHNLLYIIDDFKQDDVHALLNAIGQHKLPISIIIVFGYSLDFTTLTSLKNNTKTTLDGVKVEVRY